VRLTGSDGSAVATIHTEAAERLTRALRKLGRELGVPGELTLSDLTRIPGLVTADAGDPAAETVWPLLRQALDEALGHLQTMRAREGAALQRDIVRRLASLRRGTAAIGRRAPVLAPRYRDLLLKRLADAGFEFDAKDPQVVKETALYAERVDISEELVRLESHLDQAEDLLESDKPVGRTLDFLCQELFREINTIGSKAADVAVVRQVIAFKAALEAMREQVQYVE